MNRRQARLSGYTRDLRYAQGMIKVKSLRHPLNYPIAFCARTRLFVCNAPPIAVGSNLQIGSDSGFKGNEV